MSGVNNREQVSDQVDKHKESGSLNQVSRPWNLRRVQIWSFVGFLLFAFAWSVRRVDLSFSGIIEIVEGWPATWSLLKRMVPPSLPSEDLDLIISLSLDTFFMAFAGTAVGLVL